jgi:predicted enzyme related to lactoylglutathione lyase
MGRGSLGLLLLGVCIAAGASAATLELPALNTPPSAEHHPGKIVWVDLVTPDLPAAEKFYSALFGWTYQQLHVGKSDYALISADGHAIGGMIERPFPVREHHQPAWLTFIAVRDVDAAKRNAVAHKAKVLADSASYGPRGRQAVLADPEGAVFAILASGSGDPPDFLAAPGDFIWSSLHAKSPDDEAAFYQDLFGYEVFETESDDATEHVLFSSDDFARASANALPSGGHRHAHWLNFVRVASCSDAAAKATAAGGRVVVEPHPDRQGGMVALLADPAGAVFGVMEWQDK